MSCCERTRTMHWISSEQDRQFGSQVSAARLERLASHPPEKCILNDK